MTAADLAARLDAKRNGDGWQAKCPAHEDSTPSLSIREGTDGRTLLHCHAGCSFDAIVGALGVEKRELFADNDTRSRDPIIAAYDYVDETGALLFQVCRTQAKAFPQRRPDGAGDWIWKLGDTRRVLYRLPQLRAAVAASKRVFVVEGEKDVAAVERVGYTATCNPGGAADYKGQGEYKGKWRREYSEMLRGADVVVVADRDDAGRAHARDVVRSLDGVARRVVLVEPAEGKDVSDHLAAGKTLADLVPVTLDEEPAASPMAATPNERPGVRFDPVDAALLHRLAERNSAPVSAVPTPFPTWNRACRDEGGGRGMARGWHIVVAGATGAGKSLLALNLVDAALRAGEHVLYISLEMSQRQLITRLVAASTGMSVHRLEPGDGHDRAIAATAYAEFCAMLERDGGSLLVNDLPLQQLADISLAISFYTAPTRPQPCRVVVVDYLQLAWLSGARDMLSSITEVSHAIRMAARQYNIVTIGLSQFNRSTTANRAERPRVEGLMGGSPLENDADQVVLLDHSTYERQGPGAARAKLLLGKNRHGPLVEIPVTWDYRTLRVREDTPDPDPDEAARAELRGGA